MSNNTSLRTGDSKNPHNEIPNYVRDDKVTEDCNTLISSLPSDKDFLGKNLCNYNGFWYYHNTLQAILDAQKHFQPRETDIILSSFPKAGTTWLKALAFALVRRERHRTTQNHPLLSHNPHSLVPFLEIDLFSEHQTPDLSTLASPRLFATHMPFLAVHETVKGTPCKVVYMCRDLKDTIVSAWHFRQKFIKREMHGTGLDTMLDSYSRGVHFYGPFWDHALSYWNESFKNPERVFFMKYEDMIKEPHSQIKRLAEFLGCPFTEEEERNGSVDEILKLCSLRNLSHLEINKTGKTTCDIDCKNFFRKGEIGDWKNHITHDMAEKLDQIIQEKLQGSGLKFE